MAEKIKDDLLEYGQMYANYGVRGGILSHSQRVSHKGLKETKLLTSRDTVMLKSKVNQQARVWDEKWKKK